MYNYTAPCDVISSNVGSQNTYSLRNSNMFFENVYSSKFGAALKKDNSFSFNYLLFGKTA